MLEHVGGFLRKLVANWSQVNPQSALLYIRHPGPQECLSTGQQSASGPDTVRLNGNTNPKLPVSLYKSGGDMFSVSFSPLSGGAGCELQVAVARRTERRRPKPRVDGSNPPGPTIPRGLIALPGRAHHLSAFVRPRGHRLFDFPAGLLEMIRVYVVPNGHADISGSEFRG